MALVFINGPTAVAIQVAGRIIKWMDSVSMYSLISNAYERKYKNDFKDGNVMFKWPNGRAYILDDGTKQNNNEKVFILIIMVFNMKGCGYQ